MKAAELLPALKKASLLRVHNGERSLSVLGLTILLLLKDIKDKNSYEMNKASIGSYLDSPRSTCNAQINLLLKEGMISIIMVPSTNTRTQAIPRLTRKGNIFVTAILK